jgi:hypothetical protein
MLALARVPPRSREALRRVLIHDQADRDAVAMQLYGWPQTFEGHRPQFVES